MNTLQIYATSTAAGSAIAQVTIPSKTTVKGILYSTMVSCKTDGAILEIELSKIPTHQIHVNGAKDPFFHYSWASNFVTSGLAQVASSLFVPLSVACRQGEIIYLHAVAGAFAGTWYFTGLLYYA